MQFRERIIYFIMALIFLLLSALSFIFSFSLISLAEIERILNSAYGNWQGAVIGLLIIIVGLWLFAKSFKSREPLKFVTQNTKHGQFMISFSALESMVLRAAKEIEGLRDLQPQIIFKEGRLNILLKVSLISDYQIPSLSEVIQEKVKNYVEEMSGVPVEEVKIFIENVVNDSSPRISKEQGV
ncbi:MAG: hypothetical protein CVU88_00100 [Firmicutes bacterium HGW-Firmicutes-13]|nr:MAG: hypothetical protein CVU88_00100 [Firmicutes bacterium HGW-Firmicutes-13]